MDRIKLTACQEILKKMDKVLKPEDNLTKRGFFKEDIFCDGGTIIMILPGLTEYIKDSKFRAVKSMKAGKKIIERLKINAEDEPDIEYLKRVLIEEKDFKNLGKREKYVRLAGSKIAVNLYTLRRIRIACGGSMIMTFNRPIDPIRFDSNEDRNRTRGVVTPVKYIEDIFPEVGERIA